MKEGKLLCAGVNKNAICPWSEAGPKLVFTERSNNICHLWLSRAYWLTADLTTRLGIAFDVQPLGGYPPLVLIEGSPRGPFLLFFLWQKALFGDDGIFFKEAEWSQIFCQSWTGTPRWISLNVLFMSSSSTANQIKHNEIEFVASSRRCTLECNNLNLEYVTFRIQANLDVTVNPT